MCRDRKNEESDVPGTDDWRREVEGDFDWWDDPDPEEDDGGGEDGERATSSEGAPSRAPQRSREAASA